jgi:hypothetical protein
MSNTPRVAVPDTPHADDELLTMQEVAHVVRVPVATLPTGATWAPARAAFASAAASATGARRSSPGSTTRPMTTARASSDFAEPRGSRRGVLRREHEQERASPREAAT